MLTSRSIPLALTSSTSRLSHLSRSFAKLKNEPQRFADVTADPRLLRSSRENALPPQAPLPKPSFFKAQSARERKQAREGVKQPKTPKITPESEKKGGKGSVGSNPNSKVSVETLRKWDNPGDFREDVRADLRKQASPPLTGSRKKSVESAILYQNFSDKPRSRTQDPSRNREESFPEAEEYMKTPKKDSQKKKLKVEYPDDAQNAQTATQRGRLFGQSSSTKISPKASAQDKPPRIPQPGFRKGQRSLRALTQELYDSSKLDLDLNPTTKAKSKNPFFEGPKLRKTVPEPELDPDAMPEWQKAKTADPPQTSRTTGLQGLEGSNLRAGLPGLQKTHPSELQQQGLRGLRKELHMDKPTVESKYEKKEKKKNETKTGKPRSLKLNVPHAPEETEAKAPTPSTKIQTISNAIQQFEFEENPNQIPPLGEIWEKKYRHLGLIRIGQTIPDKKYALFKKSRDLTLDSMWEFLKTREFIVPNSGTDKAFKMLTVSDSEWKWGKVPEGTRTLFVFTSEEEKQKFANFYKLFDQGFEVMNATALAKAMEKEHQENSLFTRLVIDGGSRFPFTFYAKEFSILVTQSHFLLLDRLLATLTANPETTVPESLYRYFLYNNFYILLRSIQDIPADKKNENIT